MSGHWTVVNASNGGPEARYEHVAAWDADLAAGRRLLWVHGGWDGQKALRDLWKFDAGTHAWTLVSNGDSGPSERWAHVCAWDAQTQQLWVHGGWDSRTNLDDLWMFHTTVGRWLSISDGTHVRPAARHDHVAVFDSLGRQLLVHGGWDGARTFRDLWTFDVQLGRWNLLHTGGNGPAARHDHVAVFDATERRLWIHGGGAVDGDGFKDLWAFHVATLQWSLVASGSGPSCWGHVAAWDGARGALWLHGGWNSGELWKFDVAANHWSLQGRSPTMWEHVGGLVETDAADRPNFWFHGGRAALITPDVPLAELWQFSQLEVECRLGQELFSQGAIAGVAEVDWWSSGAGMSFFAALFLMLVALITALVADRIFARRLASAGLRKPWAAPPSKDVKRPGPSPEDQVGFSGFAAHGLCQILGHVQAAQLRVLPGDLQKVIDYVFDAKSKGKEGDFLEKELGNRASKQKYNQLAEDFLQRGCFVFLWRWLVLFGSIHPWSKACCLSFYISHASRVAMAVTQLLAAAAITVLAYASSSLERSLDEECRFSRSLTEKILWGIYVALLSWVVLLLLHVARHPGCLGRCCATLSLVIFVCLLVLLSLLCVYLTVVFLGNVSTVDAGDWLFTWMVAVIVALLIAPLFLAFSLDVFLSCFMASSPASAQHIKVMRQVTLPPEAVATASIWDGDILDLAPIRLGREPPRPPPTIQEVHPVTSVSPPVPEGEEETDQCDVAASMVQVALCSHLACWEAPQREQRVRLHFARSEAPNG